MTIREVIDTYPKDEACFMLSRFMREQMGDAGMSYDQYSTPEKLESEYAIHLKNAEDCPNLQII
jgi:hypothetical protein